MEKFFSKRYTLTSQKILWVILILLTIGRLVIAATGSLSGQEAYLNLCAQHLDWGFVEGPPGVSALMRLSVALGGASPLGVRMFSPLLLLLASLVLERLVSQLYGKQTAFWSVLALNVLPLANAAGVVMEGTMVKATLWIISLSWAWFLVEDKRKSFLAWSGFGVLLGVTTQVSYAVGWLLPLVTLMVIIRYRHLYVLGVASAFFILLLSWVGPLWWNSQHDWLQWSYLTWGSFWSWNIDFFNTREVIDPTLDVLSRVSTAGASHHYSLLVYLGRVCQFCFTQLEETLWYWLFLFSLPLLFIGVVHAISSAEKKKRARRSYFLLLLVVPALFCIGGIGHEDPSLALQLVLMAMMLPNIISFFHQTKLRKKVGLFLLFLAGAFSLLLMLDVVALSENNPSWAIPSSRGVKGIREIAAELVRLRAVEGDLPPPFLIAQTPELAALLGTTLVIHYPELPGAPSVFTPESPSFSSQFQLWPHYATAVAGGAVDPLYTEESATSPFLGHAALYVTAETLEEIPESITGAFGSVALLSKGTLQRGRHQEQVMIYLCKNYQMLPF